MQAEVPDEWALHVNVGKHSVRRLRRGRCTVAADATIMTVGRAGRMLQFADDLVLVNRPGHAPAGAKRVLLSRFPLLDLPDGARIPCEQLRWMPGRSALAEVSAADPRAVRDEVLASWQGQFEFRAASADTPGLRGAQLGALHGLLAHWSMSDETATVVLPTGTGKTDTMIAALIAERLAPLLVVVPTLPLRDQISRKFATLGVLPLVGAVPGDIALPTVGTLEGRLIDVAELDALLASCRRGRGTTFARRSRPGGLRSSRPPRSAATASSSLGGSLTGTHCARRRRTATSRRSAFVTSSNTTTVPPT